METLPRMIETQSYNSRKRKTPLKIIRLNVCTQTPCVSGSYQILKLFSGTIFWSLSSVTSETWTTFLPQFGLWEQNITRKCQRVWFPHFKFKRGGEWIGSLPRMAFQKNQKTFQMHLRENNSRVSMLHNDENDERTTVSRDLHIQHISVINHRQEGRLHQCSKSCMFL